MNDGKTPLESITSLLKKLSGVRWYLVYNLNESRVVDRSPTIAEDKLRDLVEMSRAFKALLERIDKIAPLTLAEKLSTSTIHVRLNGEELEVESVNGNILLVNVDEKALSMVSELFALAKKGEVVKCSVCGRELSYEAYTCPRCGRTISFIASACPFCKYDVRFKRCPSHRGLIDHRGMVARRDVGVIAITSFIASIAIAIAWLMSTVYPGVSFAIYGLSGLVAAFLVAIGIVSSKPRV